ncbi:cathepsin W [Ctenodactylus gundi]
MALTVYFCVLVLLMTRLAQGFGGPLRSQDPGPRPLELKEVFKLFQIQFNRSYLNPAEYARRLDVFAHNLAQAQQLQEEDLGTAEFGMTPFSDLTEEEFGQLYGHRRTAGRDPRVGRKVRSEEQRELVVPQSCDWRKQASIISPVKNQGSCKCCWAMAAAGNIEALWGIRFQQFVEVSVQELLDCDYCRDGCTGGFVWEAYITVLNQSGLASEKDYPFQGHTNPHGCRARRHRKVAWIQDFIMLQDDEQVIAEYVATQGPITVTINMQKLQHYQKGVIQAKPRDCDPRLVDHSVLLVGFGKSKVGGPRQSIPHWILKNSWGANWGEKGYFRLHRGSNTCGITKYPLTARVVLAPKKQPVSCPP